MKIPNFFAVLFVVAGATMFSSGCKSNSTSPKTSTDPAKAAQLVTAASEILIPRVALIATLPSDTAAFDLSSANILYSQALDQDPGNLDAHFGFALTEVLTLFSDPTVAKLQQSGEVGFSENAMLSILKSGGVQQFTRPITSDVLGKIRLANQPSLALHTVLAKSQAGQLPSHDQAIVETNILPVLANAIVHLQQVTNTPCYQFLITPQLMGVNNGPTYRIDLTEIYLLLAVFQFFDADGSLFVAYNTDYTSSTASSVTQAWQPSSPFLTLRTNGVQRMKDTRTNYLAMATSIRNGLTFLMHETPHPETDVIVYNPQDQSQVQSAIQDVDSLTAFLSGPYSIGGATANVGSLFLNPITDVKAKLPAYTASSRPNSSGTYDAVLTWQASSFDTWVFPDPTFNGFLPGMTNSGLKQMFEINASTWSSSVIISG